MRKFLLLFLFMSVSLKADWTEKIMLNGYFSFEYEKNLDRENGGGYQGDPNGSFDSDLFDLVLNVHPSDKVRVAADVTWEHGPSTEDDRGNVALEYAFAEYIHSQSVKFRAGKMFTAFGIYNELHTAKPATINYKEPLSTNKIHYLGGSVNFFTRWGSGVAVLGDSMLYGHPLDYIIQVTNGQNDGEGNPYDTDDNVNKAVTARIRVDLSNDLQLGASFYTDTYSEYNSTNDIEGEGKIVSYGLQTIWKATENTRLQAEFVGGTLKEHESAKVTRYGFNIMPTYDLTDTLTLYYMYEFFDPDTDTGNDTSTLHNLGFNYELDDVMFIKCEIYNQKSQDDALLTYTQFRAAFVVGF